MGARSSDAERGPAVAPACVQRLRRSSDVRAAFAARGAAGTAHLVVHGRRRSDDGAPRTTVVAGKAVGNAVARNRVKRRLRAALAQVSLPTGFDLVVVGRPNAARAPFPALCQDLDTAVARLARRA